MGEARSSHLSAQPRPNPLCKRGPGGARRGDGTCMQRADGHRTDWETM